MKNNKLKKVILSAITATMISCSLPFTALAAVQVNPIENLSTDFIKGADVSIMPELERNGTKFYDNGIEQDGLTILKNHGVNWIRVRIWNNPYVVGPEGVGGGNTDEAKAIEMAKRAKALGMKVLVDFHYSDFWVDPGQQKKPDAWKNDSGDKLVDDVYAYTAKVMQDFNAQGVTPDMVQVGNELNNGMLWPEAQLTEDNPNGYKFLAKLLNAGLQAVHDNDKDNKVKTMIHLAGVDVNLYHTFFDNLIVKNKVNDFDIIGMSFYPFWHGTMDDLKNTMNDVSAKYNKDVIAVETAFGYTLEDADFEKNNFGTNEEKVGGYKATVQGQATGLRDVMATVASVNDNRGLGIFYWAPDWVINEKVGWKSNGGGNGWDNLTLFDTKGSALESMDTFNLVSDPNNQYIEPQVTAINTVDVKDVSLYSNVDLPQTVGVVYSNDAVKNMSVKWDVAKPIFAKPGNYTISGTVEGLAQKAIANIEVKNKMNLVLNGNFENETLNGWDIVGDSSAINLAWNQGDVRDKCAMHYWNNKPFNVIIKQKLKGLSDGKYTLSCWTQGNGLASKYQLFVKQNGVEMTTDIKDDGWNRWHQTSIKNIEVKNGEVEIGFILNGRPDTWGSIDDIEFYVQK
ncbi:glycosyl hydrolase 53 family protein [Megamonas funiformis]|uniref:glycosyl hydrolase 53 family protein n=1 Tax=Megamonas funiformis TaxID=437897 RepID=UPI001CD4EA64|nr:glycosyl hydrolase 53 family protein [Megamonas funiformis]UBS48223.1 glycosyl hydrolase 53 family protein [Megamonas funiformis]GLU98020.1 arabinogalactan endo-beta-1,4-galactanase [Megamonas funiformis]